MSRAWLKVALCIWKREHIKSARYPNRTPGEPGKVLENLGEQSKTHFSESIMTIAGADCPYRSQEVCKKKSKEKKKDGLVSLVS